MPYRNPHTESQSRGGMLRRILLLICLVLAVLTAAAPEGWAIGSVPVRNFMRDEYNGGPQNWAAVQDSAGVMYVANRDCMLAFDGQRWQRHFLANYTTVRTLYYDHDNDRIYAAGTQELGYFAPSKVTGLLEYTSMMPMFGGKVPPFTEVWNIFRTPHGIWFQSDYHLYLKPTGKTGFRVLYAPGRISRSAVIGDQVLVATDDGRLLRVSGEEFKPVPGSEVLAGKKIVGLLPMRGGRIVVATSIDGLWLVDGETVRPMESDINPFLKENQIFCAATDGDDYIFGTVNCGAVIKNLASGRSTYLNRDNGLQNNTVLGVSFDRHHNLWLCLDNGLDYAVYNSPVSNLIGPNNAVGAGYASLRRDGMLYFGTNQGLYSTPYPIPTAPGLLPLHRELHGQIWSLTSDGHTIFVAGDAGIYTDDGHGFTKIDGAPGAHMVMPLPDHPDMALASTYDSFHLLAREGGGWVDRGRVSGYDDIGGHFLRDPAGDIWIAHWRKGIYRMHLNIGRQRFERLQLYDRKSGLPDNNDNSIAILDGSVVVSTRYGLYTYDARKDRMVPDTVLGKAFPRHMVGTLHTLSDGSLMMAGSNGLSIARRHSDGSFAIDTTSLKSYTRNFIPGYVDVQSVDDRNVIVSNQDGFWSIDLKSPSRTPILQDKPFVSAVYADRDSLVYAYDPAGNGARRELRLPYALRSLRFNFGFPNYRSSSAVEFSSWLEGYDGGWSPWSEESVREYTRLSPGDYTLHLRARDMQTGNVEETSLSIVILPPWYRTVWAYIVYALLALMVIWWGCEGAKRWIDRDRQAQDLKRRREVEAMRQRAEQEADALRRQAEQEALKKDYEIATLKSEQLEQDIQHKSQELSSTAMNVIRKNETLHEIAVKVAAIRDSKKTAEEMSPAVQRKLTKLISFIEDSIGEEDDWKDFSRNFDIVYRDFTKRLLEECPTLSQADMRLSCYIKMGLSSKEIAPMLNISSKSVEMARYRLRKKLGLTVEQSLTSYLLSL